MDYSILSHQILGCQIRFIRIEFNLHQIQWLLLFERENGRNIISALEAMTFYIFDEG